MSDSPTLDLSVSLGGLSKSMDGLSRQLATEQALRPHPARSQAVLSTVASFTSSAQLTSLAQVPGGMAWSVERVSFGVTPGTAAPGTPGTIILFIGVVEIARTITVPNFLTFRGYQCYVIPNEDLQAVWVGGVGGPLLVDVQASEYPILTRTQKPSA
jgi:hypothetical protein